MAVTADHLTMPANENQSRRVFQLLTQTLFQILARWRRSGLVTLPLLTCLSLASTASASGIVLNFDADAADLQTALASAHAAAPREWQVMLPAASGKRAPLLLRTYQPFAKGARVYLDEQALGPDDYDVTTVYARGTISGVPNSFAFLALRANGDADLRYSVDSAETRILVENGQRRSEERVARDMGPNAANPFLDDVSPPPDQGFVIPQSSQTSRPVGATSISTQNRSETLSGGPGWSSVYTLTVPAGQALTGAASKGPGSASVVIIKDLDPTTNWSTSSCYDGTYLYSECLIENPDAGTYNVAAYKYDSSDTTLVFNYAETLSENQQLSATIAVDTDAGFYNYFASTDDILDYLAALFGYTSAIYETEVNTELLMGDLFLFSSSTDPYTSPATSAERLDDVEAYWLANRSGVTRTLAAHLSSQNFGGRAALDALCSESRGYSVSGVYGIAPDSGQPLIWDAYVFAHELGHNFSSQHTHCYAGEGGNPDPVDACYNSESSCWAGTEDLPGMNSLTGGTTGSGNGTIMSYCHQITGGVSNISATLGKDHTFGIVASRVSDKMANRAFEVAAIDQSCIAINTTAITVTPSAQTGGTISPDTDQSVAPGGTSDFILSADSGYLIDGVTGTCPGSLSEDTFTAGPVVEDCTVIANFAAITPPSGVTIDQTDVGDGEIYLTVSVSSDGGSTITSYDAVCSDGTTDFSGQSTTTTITVSGLENDDNYTCTVTATNSAGTSSASAASGTLTPEPTPGLPIWLLEAISGDTPGDRHTPLILRGPVGLDSDSKTFVKWWLVDDSNSSAATAPKPKAHRPRA